MAKPLTLLAKRYQKTPTDALFAQIEAVVTPLMTKMVRQYVTLSHSPEDRMQMARLVLLSCLREFDPARGTEFLTLFYARLKAFLWNLVRRQPPVPDQFPEVEILSILTSTNFAGVSDEKIVLSVALARLPERERKALTLLFFEQWSQAEVARNFGVSDASVSKLRAKALKTLQSRLQNDLYL